VVADFGIGSAGVASRSLKEGWVTLRMKASRRRSRQRSRKRKPKSSPAGNAPVCEQRQTPTTRAVNELK
jgi:hypothetical protein